MNDFRKLWFRQCSTTLINSPSFAVCQTLTWFMQVSENSTNRFALLGVFSSSTLRASAAIAFAFMLNLLIYTMLISIGWTILPRLGPSFEIRSRQSISTQELHQTPGAQQARLTGANASSILKAIDPRAWNNAPDYAFMRDKFSETINFCHFCGSAHHLSCAGYFPRLLRAKALKISRSACPWNSLPGEAS